MYKNYDDVANQLGISASVISKYRQIGLLDDLVEVMQKGKVKEKRISNKVIDRIKDIQRLQYEGYDLKKIIHKLVPVSIFEISIENGSGTHRIEKRVHFTLITSDKIEPVFFKNEPQKISENEMKKVRDMLIEEGNYELAEKINFTPQKFTFLFNEFEETIFENEFLRKQRMLRGIQENVKPLRWFENDNGKLRMNELYSGQQQYDNYNQCLKTIPVVIYSGLNKYVIRYNIGIRFLDTIQFSNQYSYLKDRLIKLYKKVMKELNISNTEEEFTSYSLANVVSEKESNLLSIIRHEEYKTIEVIKKNGDILTIKATKSQYNANMQELIEIYKNKGYKKISVTQNDGGTFFITETDHYKI